MYIVTNDELSNADDGIEEEEESPTIDSLKDDLRLTCEANEIEQSLGTDEDTVISVFRLKLLSAQMLSNQQMIGVEEDSSHFNAIVEKVPSRVGH